MPVNVGRGIAVVTGICECGRIASTYDLVTYEGVLWVTCRCASDKHEWTRIVRATTLVVKCADKKMFSLSKNDSHQYFWTKLET